MKTEVSIRPATSKDAQRIAEIHVLAWQWAYRGRLSDEYLDGLSVEEGEPMWQELLADPGERRAWVAELGERVVGFSSTGPPEDEDAPTRTAEVYTIYLDPHVAGTGIGRELFSTTVEDLRARGFQRATLWVLESNELARRFNEKAGWRLDGRTSTERIDCENLPTVRYSIELR